MKECGGWSTCVAIFKVTKYIYTNMCEWQFIKSSTFQQKSKIFQAIASVSPTILNGSFFCLQGDTETVWLTATLRLSRSSLSWQGEGRHTARACISAASCFQQDKMSPVCEFSRMLSDHLCNAEKILKPNLWILLWQKIVFKFNRSVLFEVEKDQFYRMLSPSLVWWGFLSLPIIK